MPYSHKQLSGEDYYAIRRLVKKGHVFITITYGEATNVVIPGNWSHAGIYVGETDGIPMVCEAVGRGVVVRPLVDFLLSKDEVRVLEPEFADEKQMEMAAEEAVRQKGAKYDYGFEFTIEPEEIGASDTLIAKPTHRAFYCVELVIWSYLKVIPSMPFKLRKRLGEPEVTADDLAKAEKHWKCLWDKKLHGTTWS